MAEQGLVGSCQANAPQSLFAQTRSVSGRAEMMPLLKPGEITLVE